jgi:autotransporter translocation and assembly factor TamB
LAVATLAVAALLGVAWLRETDIRGAARRGLEALLDSLLLGEVHIDRITRISFAGIEAEGVGIVDPEGRAVLNAGRISLGLSPLSLLRSQLRFTHGLVEDVRVRAYASAKTGISLFDAFLPAATSNSTAPSRLQIRFEHVHLRNLAVRGDVLGLAGLDANTLDARGEIIIDSDLHVKLTEVHGTLRGPVAAPVAIEHATFALQLVPFAAEAHARLRRAADHVRLSLRYTDASAPAGATATTTSAEIDAIAELSPVSADLLSALSVPASEVLLPDLRGYLHVKGPVSQPTFSATLDSQAGAIRATGSFGSAATQVVIASQDIALEKLIAYAPPVHSALRVEASRVGDAPIRITLRAPEIELYDLHFQAARVEGTYTPDDRFLLNDTHIEYAGGRFNVSGYVDADANLDLRVRSHVPEVARDPTVRAMGLRAGVDTDVHIAAQDGRAEISGKIDFANFAFQGVSAKRLQLKGALRFSDSPLPAGNLQGYAEDVVAFGQSLGELTLAARGQNGRYKLRTTLQERREGVAAAATIALQSNGVRHHIASQDLSLSVGARNPWHGDAQVVVDNDGVQFERLVLAAGDQRLSLAGAYSFRRAYRLDAQLQQFDLGGLRTLLRADLADLDGVVDGTVVLSGTPGRPRADVHAKLTDGVYLGMEGLNLGLALVYADRHFDLDTDLTLADGSRIRAYADGEPGSGPDFASQVLEGEYDFGLEFTRVPFTAAAPWLAWYGLTPPPGNLSIQLSAQGRLNAPRFALSAQLAGFKLNDDTLLDAAADLRFNGSELTVQHVRVGDTAGALMTGNGKMLVTSAELRDPEALRSTLATRDFELFLASEERRLDTLPAPLRLDFPWTFQAELSARNEDGKPSVNASVRGNLFAESAAACGALARGQLTADLHLSGTEGTAIVDLVADSGDSARARLNTSVQLGDWLDGTATWEPPKTSLALTANAGALEELPYACDYAAGPLRLSAQATDIFARPPDLTFTIASPSFQLVPHADQRQRLGNLRGARTVSRPFAIEVRGDVDGHGVTFAGQVDSEAGGSARVDATVSRAAFRLNQSNEPASLDLRSDFRMLELAPLLVGLPMSTRLSGVLNGLAHVRYDFRNDDLALDGSLNLSAGKLAITALGQELQDLHAQFSLGGDHVEIRSAAARDLTGRIDIGGTIALAGTRAARLSLKLALANFPLRREGTQVSRLTGKVDLLGDIGRERTSVELQIGELQANLPADLGLTVQSLDPHPAVVVAGSKPPAAPPDPYTYDLRVVAQRSPFRVLRSDLSAEVATDLLLRYREPSLTMEGGATLLRGNFELFGKRFELEPSSLVFDIPETLDPLVSLHATHRVASDTIGVRVDGRLSAPKVTFSHSNPAITDTGAIVAQLLGGRSYDPSRTDRDATGAAAGVLAGATAGLLTAEAQRQFAGALPSVSMESGGTTFRGTRIRAGVQLDQVIDRKLGPLRKVVRGAYVEGFVAPGAAGQTATSALPPQSRGGGLLELRFPRDLVGTVEYRPTQNWRIDLAWEP